MKNSFVQPSPTPHHTTTPSSTEDDAQRNAQRTRDSQHNARILSHPNAAHIHAYQQRLDVLFDLEAVVLAGIAAYGPSCLIEQKLLEVQAHCRSAVGVP